MSPQHNRSYTDIIFMILTVVKWPQWSMVHTFIILLRSEFQFIKLWGLYAGTHHLAQCFSNFNGNMNHLGILLKWKLWFITKPELSGNFSQMYSLSPKLLFNFNSISSAWIIVTVSFPASLNLGLFPFNLSPTRLAKKIHMIKHNFQDIWKLSIQNMETRLYIPSHV